MKALFRKLVFGEKVIREYSTVRIGDKIQERVYLQGASGGPVLDISGYHWVFCLEPLVFGVWMAKGETAVDGLGRCKIVFRDGPLQPGQDLEEKALAVGQLDPVNKIEESNGCLFLLRLQSCVVHHIPSFKTRLLYAKYYKKPGLSFEKLIAFATAYSYPRRVRVVSFRDTDYYNIFPMDLVGDISHAGRYAFGLRHTNLALSRIIGAKKIAVSEVPFEKKETIYQLGSHHSTNPPSIDKLPFGVVASPEFGFWIPDWADSCKEIRILRTIDLGSHMLLWGEPVGEAVLNPVSEHLHHIHFLLYLHQKKHGGAYPQSMVKGKAAAG
jgi:hypothetical protein